MRKYLALILLTIYFAQGQAQEILYSSNEDLGGDSIRIEIGVFDLTDCALKELYTDTTKYLNSYVEWVDIALCPDGILYGLGDDVLPQEIVLPKTKPVMSLTSRITHLKHIYEGDTLGYGRTFTAKKDSVIATIPIGYQDGYSRGLSNCGRVIINDQFAPVVGRVSMDWTIVDVTEIENVKINDEVILIGQTNDKVIKTEELAEKTATISYEITCGINRRVPRIYVGS